MMNRSDITTYSRLLQLFDSLTGIRPAVASTHILFADGHAVTTIDLALTRHGHTSHCEFQQRDDGRFHTNQEAYHGP